MELNLNPFHFIWPHKLSLSFKLVVYVTLNGKIWTKFNARLTVKLFTNIWNQNDKEK